MRGCISPVSLLPGCAGQREPSGLSWLPQPTASGTLISAASVDIAGAREDKDPVHIVWTGQPPLPAQAATKARITFSPGIARSWAGDHSALLPVPVDLTQPVGNSHSSPARRRRSRIVTMTDRVIPRSGRPGCPAASRVVNEDVDQRENGGSTDQAEVEPADRACPAKGKIYGRKITAINARTSPPVINHAEKLAHCMSALLEYM